MTAILETPSIHIRHFEESDFAGLLNLDTDPEVMKYIGNGKIMTEDQVRSALKRIISRYDEMKEFGIWAAELKSTSEFIGWFALKPLPGTHDIEIGYRLLKKHWGHGYATEGATALLKYGFDILKISKIVAITNPSNLISKRVLEKIGLRYEHDIEYRGSPDAETSTVSLFTASR
jgi:RimJ/RimL family protein N-acetyltransferase